MATDLGPLISRSAIRILVRIQHAQGLVLCPHAHELMHFDLMSMLPAHVPHARALHVHPTRIPNSMAPLRPDPISATKVWTISPRSRGCTSTAGNASCSTCPKLEEIDKLVLVGKVQVVRSRPSRTTRNACQRHTKHVHVSEYELQNEVRPIGYMPH